MFYDLVEKKITVKSGYMDYVAFGKGQKNLIIIPGLSVRDVKGAGISLALMYKIFAKDYRVYFMGRPHNVNEGLTIWDLADDISCAMDELSIEKADVYGVSQGGMIGLALALNHPEKVSKLVLGVTCSRPNETLKNAVGGWIKYAQEKNHVAINKETFSLMYTEQYLNKYRLLMPLLVKMAKPASFERFVILASSILSFDCYDRLKEIKCPVLVLGADQDKITTEKGAREIAEKLNCEFYIYSGYGHAAFEEAPDFTERICKFLALGQM